MIGRQEEIRTMKNLLKSNTAKLLTVTGRRRVGKTYLVREVFKDYNVFEFVGTKNVTMKNQLDKFDEVLQSYFSYYKQSNFSNWAQAFSLLKQCYDSLRKSKKKQVIFFDEFPWINSDKSGFLDEFSYWWNSWASKQNVIVVISGSDAAWLIENITNNKDGLYNRASKSIHLEPFSLHEVKQYFKSKFIKFNNYEIAQIYMIMGGIPFYLDEIESGESVNQVINRLCFRKNGLLYKEFSNLYSSLFDNPENYIDVVRALSTKWKGLTRKEIIKFTKISNGGGLTKVLKNLALCSFIEKVSPYGKIKKESLYRLVDEFTIFYFNFMENVKLASGDSWTQKSKTSAYTGWTGYAFENLCLRHHLSIAMALGISGTYAELCSYTAKGIQVDLIFDRSDNIINLFEIKFYNDEYVISKAYSETLRKRKATFINTTGTKKVIFNSFITTYGVKENEYKRSQVDGEVLLTDLFEQKKL
jgi:uncharacterized protein